MKKLYLLMILICVFTNIFAEPVDSSFIKIFEKKANIVTSNNEDTFIIEKSTDGYHVRIILITYKGDRVIIDKIQNYIPYFARFNKPCDMIKSYFLLDYLNNSLGIADIDHDGRDEVFFIYLGGSSHGLVIMDYVDNTFKVVTQAGSFIKYYPVDNKLYLLSRYTPVVSVGDKAINSYCAYTYKDGQLVASKKLPEKIYNELHEEKYRDYIEENKFYAYFMFLYNNNSTVLNKEFVDDNFKSNKKADLEYKSTANVKRLLEKEFSGYSYTIHESKYFYYYLLDTLK